LYDTITSGINNLEKTIKKNNIAKARGEENEYQFLHPELNSKPGTERPPARSSERAAVEEGAQGLLEEREVTMSAIQLNTGDR
jgi:hypothetical protein